MIFDGKFNSKILLKMVFAVLKHSVLVQNMQPFKLITSCD